MNSLNIYRLICCLLAIPAVTRAAETSLVFRAADFSERARAEGQIVADPAATGGQALVVAKPLVFETYGMPELHPGWHRVTVRAKVNAPPSPLAKLTFRFWNPGNPGSFRFETSFAPQEFSAVGQFIELKREFRIGPRGSQYGSSLTDGWPGLLLDTVTIERLDTTVRLERVWPDKILYGTRETGSLAVVVRNEADQATTAHLTVEIESGLGQRRRIHDGDVTIPARPADGAPVELKIPLPPQAPYGHAVVATLRQGDTVLGSARELFYVHDNPVEIGHLGISGFSWNGAGYGDGSEAIQEMMQFRSWYFPMAEMCFWAPDDAIMLTPPPGRDRWWSGQTLRRLSTVGMQNYVRTAHAQGIKVLAYTDLRLDFGFQITEFFRKNPELCHWDANDFFLAYNVRDLQNQARMDDAEKLEAQGVWALMTGNPKMLDFHIAQLVACAELFGFDGFRYDDPCDYDFAAVDVLGRQMPFPGWNNPVILGQIRGALEKRGLIYGHNMYAAQAQFRGDAMSIDSQPYERDLYSEVVGNGGLHLQEHWVNMLGRGHEPWDKVAEFFYRQGYNGLRWDAHVYNILDAHHAPGADGRYLLALNLASMCHVAYHIPADAVGYMRLACRYADLFYGENLVPLRDAEKTLAVDAGGKDVWWQRYVRYREVEPGHRIYLVNLINPPRNAKIGEGDSNPPDPLTDVRLSWTLPKGWKVTKAWHLAGEGSPEVHTTFRQEGERAATFAEVGRGLLEAELPVRGKGRQVEVTLPSLQMWSVVALDCRGPKNDRAPVVQMKLPPVPPRPAPQPPVTVTGEHSPNGLGAPWVYDWDWTNPSTYTLVADADATGGQAIRVTGQVESYRPGEPLLGGTYRISFRLKNTAAPQPEDTVEFQFWPPLNRPGAFRFTKKVPLAELTPDKGWQTISVETELGFGWENCGILLRNAPASLLVDWVRIEQVKLWPDSKMLTERKGQRWPADLALTPHTGIKVWYGEGLYYEPYGVLEALKKIPGTTVVESPHFVWRERRGFTGQPWQTPQELAGYDLVVIANVDLKTFTVEQRDWLRGYVEAGGKLLLLGGPYGFGRGYWHESELLAAILPVTMRAFDLRSDGATLTGVAGWPHGVNWSAAPRTLWRHQVAARAGATVRARAGDHPAIVTGTAGKGRVGVVLVTPLGDEQETKPAWWRWAEWPKVMEALLRELLS